MPTPTTLPTNWQLPEVKATVPVIETQKTTGILRNIWNGIKNLFTRPNPPVTAEGNTVILQDQNGNPIVAKSSNYNWEAILSGVGALVGIIVGAKNGTYQNQTQYGQNYDVNGQLVYDQNVRSGKTAITLVIIGAILLIGSLFAINKLKPKK